MDGIGDGPDGMGFDMKMMMNQQPNPYRGTFAQDASPVYSGLPGPSFQDDPAMGMGEDQNDAKRRRIARVSPVLALLGLYVWFMKLIDGLSGYARRLAICVARRRSSAMGKCPSARIASTTRPTAFSPPSRKSATRPRGMSALLRVVCCVGMALTARFRAKYIEGLENRLGRMESLLRLSGLLSEDDGGKTDLGTLEKRLADRSVVNEPSSSTSSNRFNVPNTSQQTSTSRQSTPRMESHSSPRTAPTSPEPQKESENEVEGLSDMMCSLVTSNSGETRYIGNFATTC